jgi:16S rRNA (adenine1518-N6/adenine1519-N6)-dimethyltransferase
MVTAKMTLKHLPHPKRILNETGLRAKKSLGQNFLTNRGVLEKILFALDLTPQTNVIEVGPGLGHLTALLAQRSKNVFGIERDPQLIECGQHTLSQWPHVELINADGASFDYSGLIEGCDGPWCVASNPPFPSGC